MLFGLFVNTSVEPKKKNEGTQNMDSGLVVPLEPWTLSVIFTSVWDHNEMPQRNTQQRVDTRNNDPTEEEKRFQNEL